MKKLCVLLLVLGLCTAANAAVQANVKVGGSAVDSVNPSDVVTVTIGNTVAGAGGISGFSMTASHAQGGTLDILGTWLLPPSPAGVVSDVGGGQKFAWNNGTIGLNVTGDWLTATFTVPGGASGKLDLSFSGTMFNEAVEGKSLTIIPEPMTVALLGLGGLFLRRRK
jgi:hypothetical protein